MGLTLVQLALYGLGALVALASFWSLIPHPAWWVRGADFPRLQLLALGAVCLAGQLALMLMTDAPMTLWQWALVISLVLALALQLKMILPFTPIYPKQVKQVPKGKLDNRRQIALLVSNVLTPNHHHQKLIDEIARHQPDVVLTLESDKAWEQALAVIEPDYPHSVKVPLDNLYGMHLYSRLPIISHEVKYLLSEEIPSIHAQVRLPCGKTVQLHCLHPEPPSPTEAPSSTLRDAELLLVGRAVKENDHTCIVMGDLNDVAWSRTTRLFGRISGLLDPRIGRYFVNTFHADHWYLRWSLDHIFHSTDFALVTMARLPHIGSDHFPVYTVLQYDGKFEDVHDAPEMQAGDEVLVYQKIKEGRQQAVEDGVETPDELKH